VKKIPRNEERKRLTHKEKNCELDKKREKKEEWWTNKGEQIESVT